MSVRLADMLRYLRKRDKLTQKELAKETGLSLASIVSYENGLREPNSRAMAVLESFFGVTGEYLRGEITNKDKFFKEVDSASNSLNMVDVHFTSFLEAYKPSDLQIQKKSADFLSAVLEVITHEYLEKPENNVWIDFDISSFLKHLIQLNNDGQNEVIKRIDELTQIQQYLD